MKVFLDFEASSLSKQSYPIEVAWIFEDGRSETHLIRPAPGWTDWDAEAEDIHHISRNMLIAAGEPHDVVARHMVETLSGHDLLASAPSWDGKWLSALLRAAGLPRHSLRLRDSDDAHREAAMAILEGTGDFGSLTDMVDEVLVLTEVRDGHIPAHRALPDAEAERTRWLAVRAAAQSLVRKSTQTAPS